MKKTIAILFALLLLSLTAFAVSAAGTTASDVPQLGSAYAVASFLRMEMAGRKAEIRFKASDSAVADLTLAQVCTHTGTGTEGDYLRLSLNYALPQIVKGADGVYVMRPVYYTTAEQEATVGDYVTEVLAGCTAEDDTAKARYLYDYLCENVTFDLENIYNDEDLLKYTAYGAAVNGRAVCQGFATLYYRLALAVGLDCRIVTGARGDVAHAWNIIKIGDQWYHVDASSGAQLLDNSAYFMKRIFDGCAIHYGNETAAEIQGYPFVIGNEGDALETGTLNNKVSWTLNRSTGVLVISGTGTTKRDLIYSYIVSPFRYKYFKSVVISEGITDIAGHLFDGRNNLTEISLPSTLNAIGDNAFDKCPIESIYLANGSRFRLIGECLIDSSNGELLLGTSSSVIPADGSVKEIMRYAFYKRTGLKNITLPGGLERIDGYAFYGCTGLTEISIPADTRNIGRSAFEYCTNLETLLFSDRSSSNELYIGMDAFSDCKKLTELSFPSGLKSIGIGAFSGCSELRKLSLPRGVTEINESAFNYCGKLESITMPVLSGTYYVRNNCLIDGNTKTLITGCSDSVIPDNSTITKIGQCAFNGCAGLETINIPSRITSVGGFNECSSLTSVTIPKSVTECNGFKYCKKLKTITFLSKTVAIAEGALKSTPCTICGFSVSTAETFALENDKPFVALCPKTDAPHNLQEIDRIEPDCLNPGYTAGTVCVDCGEWVSGHEQTSEPLGHNPGEPVPENVVAATCTTEGSYDNVTRCTRCGIVLVSTPEKIAMLPHADDDRNGYCDDCGAYICEHPETTLQNSKATSCTENGYSGDTVCDWCGVTLEYGVTLLAPGHSPAISMPARIATCLDPGMTAEYACAACHVVTTAAQPTPITDHADGDGDGLCDVCFAPVGCKQYGRCGDALFWYVENDTLVISGIGSSGELNTVPWSSCADSIDCAYLRDSVTAMDGAGFAACPNLEWVFAPAGATVSRCGAPVLCYADENGAVTVSGRDGAPAMDLPALLNAADVLCTDRVLVSLCFERLSLCAADGGDKVVYDILKNGKLINEHHFRLPSGTELTAFSVKPLGYPSYNAAFAAMQSNPDRNLILSLSCTDLLPENLKSDSASYTEQFVLHFVDEPDTPETPEPPAPEKPSQPSFFERFTATLAAILSVFKSIFRIFRKK